jgi:c-di-GMP-binding flagellar brake protein YcgR
MGEIKQKQKTKLLFKLNDGSEKEVESNIKSLDHDRIYLNITDEALEQAEYLQEGEEITAKIFTPLGVKVFDAIVINSPLEDDFVIEYAEQATNVQRREYTRVDFDTKVIIERKEAHNIVTQTLDISGGGLRFLYKGEFLPNEKVHVMLYLPYQLRSIQADAVILKKGHVPKNEHIVLFTKIDEPERDKIIKQCFEIQRKKLLNTDEE